jgi:hypothetical protein
MLSSKSISLDLVDLEDISEQSILNVIEERYQNNDIYSSIGTILIAINPYKEIKALYSNELLKEYARIDEAKNENDVYSYEKPHVWTIAKNAYRHLLTYQTPQAIVISGESGGIPFSACLLNCFYLTSYVFLQLERLRQQRNVCNYFQRWRILPYQKQTLLGLKIEFWQLILF